MWARQRLVLLRHYCYCLAFCVGRVAFAFSFRMSCTPLVHTLSGGLLLPFIILSFRFETVACCFHTALPPSMGKIPRVMSGMQAGSPILCLGILKSRNRVRLTMVFARGCFCRRHSFFSFLFSNCRFRSVRSQQRGRLGAVSAKVVGRREAERTAEVRTGFSFPDLCVLHNRAHVG